MALDMYPGETFLLLLKDGSRAFRYHGLYALDLKQGRALKMLGRGPCVALKEHHAWCCCWSW